MREELVKLPRWPNCVRSTVLKGGSMAVKELPGPHSGPRMCVQNWLYTKAFFLDQADSTDLGIPVCNHLFRPGKWLRLLRLPRKNAPRRWGLSMRSSHFACISMTHTAHDKHGNPKSSRHHDCGSVCLLLDDFAGLPMDKMCTSQKTQGF